MAAHVAQQHFRVIAAEDELPAGRQRYFKALFPLGHIYFGAFGILYPVPAEIPDRRKSDELRILDVQPGNLVKAQVERIIAEVKAIWPHLQDQGGFEHEVRKKQPEDYKENNQNGIGRGPGAHRPALDDLLVKAVPHHQHRGQDRQPEQAQVQLLPFFVDDRRITHGVFSPA